MKSHSAQEMAKQLKTANAANLFAKRKVIKTNVEKLDIEVDKA